MHTCFDKMEFRTIHAVRWRVPRCTSFIYVFWWERRNCFGGRRKEGGWRKIACRRRTYLPFSPLITHVSLFPSTLLSSFLQQCEMFNSFLSLSPPYVLSSPLSRYSGGLSNAAESFESGRRKEFIRTMNYGDNGFILWELVKLILLQHSTFPNFAIRTTVTTKMSTLILSELRLFSQQ